MLWYTWIHLLGIVGLIPRDQDSEVKTFIAGQSCSLTSDRVSISGDSGYFSRTDLDFYDETESEHETEHSNGLEMRPLDDQKDVADPYVTSSDNGITKLNELGLHNSQGIMQSVKTTK